MELQMICCDSPPDDILPGKNQLHQWVTHPLSTRIQRHCSGTNPTKGAYSAARRAPATDQRRTWSQNAAGSGFKGTFTCRPSREIETHFFSIYTKQFIKPQNYYPNLHHTPHKIHRAKQTSNFFSHWPGQIANYSIHLRAVFKARSFFFFSFPLKISWQALQFPSPQLQAV